MAKAKNKRALTKWLRLSYKKLEQQNLAFRLITDPGTAEASHVKWLRAHPGIKAVTVWFSNINGKLLSLDYSVGFFLGSLGNLTFDGSSVEGLSRQAESDLRLQVDWTSFTLLPADVFGAGKVGVFANVCNRDGSPYDTDFRGRLQQLTRDMFAADGTVVNVAAEVEGTLVAGVHAEQQYLSEVGFSVVTNGGYFDGLPGDVLRLFIDRVADALRAMGLRMEKDHGEVASAQYEINYSDTDGVRACDQVQLYQLVCREIARSMGMTACFVPKPIAGVNGNGMHINVSLSRDGVNLFHDPKGRDGLSEIGWAFTQNILDNARRLCLIMCSSVNAFRRLGKEFEAPTKIMASANNRGAVIRIPEGNAKTARIEVRAVAPDANIYMLIYALVTTGMAKRPQKNRNDRGSKAASLPRTISQAIKRFDCKFIRTLLGESAAEKYLAGKISDRDHAPAVLGLVIKTDEIRRHHRVITQAIRSQF